MRLIQHLDSDTVDDAGAFSIFILYRLSCPLCCSVRYSVMLYQRLNRQTQLNKTLTLYSHLVLQLLT